MASGSEDYWTTSGRLLAGLIEAIKASVISGGDLLNALGNIDTSVGSVITLADLNNASCQLLAKLTGIDTSLLTGGNLLDALDALDGTMDGKLTLSELNVSSVKTNLDDSLTKLDTTITALANQLAKLTSIEAQAVGASSVHASGRITATTTPQKVLDAYANRVKAVCNIVNASIFFGYNNTLTQANAFYHLASNQYAEIIFDGYSGEVWVIESGTSATKEVHYVEF